MSHQLPEQRSNRTQERAPFADLDQLGERMRRMLEQTFGDFAPFAPAISEAITWVPAIDIEEEDDAYVVEAELPGVKREDVNIELVGNELAITGEVKEKKRRGTLRRRTRRVGRFELRVRLPDQVEPEEVDANLSDGVLTVRVPKAQRAQRRHIEIQSS